MELWSWDLYECSGGTISGLGWLSIHVSTILYFMLMICYTYRSSASEKCNNCKTLTELKQLSAKLGKKSCSICDCPSHLHLLQQRRTRIHSRLQRSIKLWSSFLQIRCTKPCLRYTRGLGVILIICTLLWWIGTGLILINIFTFTPFLWKPCGGTKLKFQERSQ